MIYRLVCCLPVYATNDDSSVSVLIDFLCFLISLCASVLRYHRAELHWLIDDDTGREVADCFAGDCELWRIEGSASMVDIEK